MAFINYFVLVLRIILGLALLVLSLPLGIIPVFRQQSFWVISLAAGLGILFHVLVDFLIAVFSNQPVGTNSEMVSSFRMETERDLTNGLIVASGVIIGLTTRQSGVTTMIGIVSLAIGIIAGFISLSVLGGAVVPTDPSEGKDTLSVKSLHHTIFMAFLNIQFVAFILGIALIA